MIVRESAIERYLVRKVRLRGGECRKLKGRRNECDRLVLWPGVDYPPNKYAPPVAHFVETKAPGKKPRPGQLREHHRLRTMGFTVLVLDTKAKVDNYIRRPC